MTPAPAQTVGNVLGQLLDRGELPERIQLLHDNTRHGLRAGDVFTWSDQARAYQCAGRGVSILAFHVRERFFEEFNWAPPEQLEIAI